MSNECSRSRARIFIGEELDGLIDDWNDLISCPQQPVPFWQMIGHKVGEVLYRARSGRLVYWDDVHEAAAMVAAAGTWRLEREGSDPYAEWRARVLPVFARIAEASPRRPVGNHKTWPGSQPPACPADTDAGIRSRRTAQSPGGVIFQMHRDG